VLKIVDTALRDVKIVRPAKFGDERGWFAELFSKRAFRAAGLPTEFVQDNQSFSRRGVLRGLHYQVIQPQGKMVRALSGHIWDVAVDLRRDSPDFGKWTGIDLREEELEWLWIPAGFAHGFLVLSETANVFYKASDFYSREGERCIRWNDAKLGIEWPLQSIGEPSVSAKDAAANGFADAELPAVVRAGSMIPD
jgi:dTDP-4-dehydrorhamnose 3,5-epimerase